MKNKKISLVLLLALSIPVTVGCTEYNTHGLPTIDMRKMEKDNFKYKFNVDNMTAFLKDLIGKDEKRIPGSNEEKIFNEKIINKYKEIGIEPKVINFELKDQYVDNNGRVEAVAEKELFKSINLPNSKVTDDNGIQGDTFPVTDINNLKEVNGKIALVKIEQNSDINDVFVKLKNAGAIGIIFTINGVSELNSGLILNNPIEIPIRQVSNDDFNLMFNTRVDNSKFIVKLVNNVERKNINSVHIMTTIKAKVDTKENIILLTNSDSMGGPGATSNGTASVALTEIARVLKDKELKKNVILIHVSSSELNLIGYKDLLKQLPKDIIDNNIKTIYLDSLASSNTLQFIVDESEKANIEDIVKKSDIFKYEVKSFYNVNSVGKILKEGGLKAMEITEINPVKGKPSDFAWSVNQSKYQNNLNSIFKILDALGI